MGTQIYVTREDMEVAGWQHNPHTSTYHSENSAGEIETFSLHQCYYTHPDHVGMKLWSYVPEDFCADYNSWGNNKPRLDSLGINLLPHQLG